MEKFEKFKSIYKKSYLEMLNRYNCCNHLLVKANIDYYGNERGHVWHYCLKCGINSNISSGDVYPNDLIGPVERAKYDYIHDIKRQNLDGKQTGLYVEDPNIARLVYLKIREKHPNLDDDTIISYLNTALNDMANIKVNEDRLKSREKRLLLNKK